MNLSRARGRTGPHRRRDRALLQAGHSLTVAQAVKLAAALHQKQSVGFVTLQNGGTHWYDNYVNYAVANSLIEAAIRASPPKI